MMPFPPIYDVYQLIRNFGTQLLVENKMEASEVGLSRSIPQLSKNQWSAPFLKNGDMLAVGLNYSGMNHSGIKKQFHDLVKNELFNVTLSTFQLYLSRLNHDT
jgi:hypothetical protein